MQSYEIFTFIICLAALFTYINHRYLKWTPTIGIMALSLFTSLIVLMINHFFPGGTKPLTAIISSIDFHSLLMKCMLGFLLFAGSIHIDARILKLERMPILILSTVGILISTFLIGSLLYILLYLFHYNIAYIYCLLFAALISPTDPIAVLAILKQAGIVKSLEMKIAGESLFNDGVAVVVFLTILEVAQKGMEHLSIPDISLLFIREAGGGMAYGILLGYAGYYALKSVHKYEVEILITLAIVMGGYQLADAMQISGPLAMVVAGIIIGSKRNTEGSHDGNNDYVFQFWGLIDELLNALLFMLVGFEMLVINYNLSVMLISLLCIGLALAARWVSVAIPVSLMRRKIRFEKHAIAILTWGGLRGGLSVALALSLPIEMHRDLFVPITYMIVVFSILVQGLTIGSYYKRLSKK